MTVANAELEMLVRREHANPHGVLGAHPSQAGVTVRALRPAASGISVVLDDGSTVELRQIHPGGLRQQQYTQSHCHVSSYREESNCLSESHMCTEISHQRRK